MLGLLALLALTDGSTVGDHIRPTGMALHRCCYCRFLPHSQMAAVWVATPVTMACRIILVMDVSSAGVLALSHKLVASA